MTPCRCWCRRLVCPWQAQQAAAARPRTAQRLQQCPASVQAGAGTAASSVWQPCPGRCAGPGHRGPVARRCCPATSRATTLVRPDDFRGTGPRRADGRPARPAKLTAMVPRRRLGTGRDQCRARHLAGVPWAVPTAPARRPRPCTRFRQWREESDDGGGWSRPPSNGFPCDGSFGPDVCNGQAPGGAPAPPHAPGGVCCDGAGGLGPGSGTWFLDGGVERAP